MAYVFDLCSLGVRSRRKDRRPVLLPLCTVRIIAVTVRVVTVTVGVVTVTVRVITVTVGVVAVTATVTATVTARVPVTGRDFHATGTAIVAGTVRIVTVPVTVTILLPLPLG